MRPFLRIIVEATRRCSWAGSALVISVAWQSQRWQEEGRGEMNEVGSGVRDEEETYAWERGERSTLSAFARARTQTVGVLISSVYLLFLQGQIKGIIITLHSDVLSTS